MIDGRQRDFPVLEPPIQRESVGGQPVGLTGQSVGRSLHAECDVPRHVVIYSPKGENHNMGLRFCTPLYELNSEVPDGADVSLSDGLRLFSLWRFPSNAMISERSCWMGIL